jgi:hypothetical protein
VDLQIRGDVSNHPLGQLRLDRLEDDERVPGADEELQVSALIEHGALRTLWTPRR